MWKGPAEICMAPKYNVCSRASRRVGWARVCWVVEQALVPFHPHAKILGVPVVLVLGVGAVGATTVGGVGLGFLDDVLRRGLRLGD